MAAPADVARHEEEQKKERAAASIVRHAALNAMMRDITMQVEVELLAKVYTPAETAKALGTCAAVGGLGEFALNPVCAKLSDAVGRRTTLLAGPLYAALGNAVLAARPFATVGGVPFVIVHKAITNVLLTISGSVSGTAALADVAEGQQLGIHLARMFGAFGLGTLLGPGLGNAAMRRGGFQAAYGLRAVAAAGICAHIALCVPETLKDPRPFGLDGLNPLGFLKLFRAPDLSLLKLLGCALLIGTAEQKQLIYLKALWLKQDVGLGIAQAQKELMAYALAQMAAGQVLAPRLIRALGERAFVRMTLLLNGLCFALWGARARPWALWLGLLLHVPGCNATGSHPVKAQVFKRGSELGLGKGELNGYYSNLRALSVAVMPWLLGQVYASQPSGKGGRAWHTLVVSSAVLPALLF